MTTIKVHTPAGMFGASPGEPPFVSALRIIAVAFGKPEDWCSKYGAEIDNDVFSMKPYCWCEGESCQWCCGDAPNFQFKPSGFRLNWYKYIGRDMKSDGDMPTDWLEQIFNSHPQRITIEQAAAEWARREDESSASMARMFEFFQSPEGIAATDELIRDCSPRMLPETAQSESGNLPARSD